MHRPTFEADDLEDRLRALAAEGKTCTAAAKALGIHYAAARRMADELGIDFMWKGSGSEDPMKCWRRRILQLSARELKANPPSVWA